MIYLIYFFGIVIIGTLVFIFFTLKWFIEEKLKTYRMQYYTPPIIERAYRGRDFFASFIYLTKEAITSHTYPINHGDTIIMDEQHKKHIIERYSIGLVDEMFKSGCIEMTEEEERFIPFQKRVNLKVKVYQPVKP